MVQKIWFKSLLLEKGKGGNEDRCAPAMMGEKISALLTKRGKKKED